ncbi:DUF2162 family putative transporter [Methanosarcina horonobensis]|uniref:DUF2162 family putative transporter n=1 Tax=Methanosarcina horonobensis TaxID=418008 RepID=UPI000AD802F4
MLPKNQFLSNPTIDAQKVLMDSSTLTVIGILIGILIFGIKTGLGCGFSNITTREILTIGGSYFFSCPFIRKCC